MKTITLVADDKSAPCSREATLPASNDRENVNVGHGPFTASRASAAAVMAQPTVKTNFLESFYYWALSRS
ncbi:MAG: hypothetical protein IH623_30040 [Verrucomicrobia bacterium]|nr:hypothetical protein [Verrucomicrobiota bacterium]